MTPIFLVANRSACFAVSDQPVSIISPTLSTTHGVSEVKLPLAYFHLGVRLGFRRACSIILTYDSYVSS